MEGDLNYGPGETQKTVPVRLLELGEKDGLMEDKQIKQFVMDLSNPRVGAKLGRYPRTTITIADEPGKFHTKHFTLLHFCNIFQHSHFTFYLVPPRAQCDYVPKEYPEFHYICPDLHHTCGPQS